MAPREYMQHTQHAKQQEKLLPLLLLENIKARGFIIRNKTLDWGGLCRAPKAHTDALYSLPACF